MSNDLSGTSISENLFFLYDPNSKYPYWKQKSDKNKTSNNTTLPTFNTSLLSEKQLLLMRETWSDSHYKSHFLKVVKIFLT